jgi:hypothetical protein
MAPALGEFEVILSTNHAEHYAVKTLMVLKTAQNLHSQSMNIHDLCSRQVANRTREAKLMLHKYPLGCRQFFVYIVPSWAALLELDNGFNPGRLNRTSAQ